MVERYTAASGGARPATVSVAASSNLQARVALVRDALNHGDQVAAARLLVEIETILTTTRRLTGGTAADGPSPSARN